jgi:hypothetical protein
VRVLLALLLLTSCYIEMPPNVEPILVPLGLITQPNKLGQYPAGALSQASGLVMRSAGLLTRAPLLETYYASPYSQATPVVPHLLGAADSMLFAIGRKASNGHWELTFFTGPATKFGNDLTSVLGGAVNFDTSGRINWTSQRGRYIFNSLQGAFVVDTGTPTTNAQALPRYAGLQAPVITPAVLTTGSPGVLTAGNVTSYIAIVRRKSTDGYEMVSPPSAPAWVGASVVSDITLNTSWFIATPGPRYAAGDVVEYYRTPQQVDGTALGSTFYLAVSYTLTAADIAAVGIVVPPIDRTADVGLTTEIYTNPGQTGFNSAKFVPPLSTWLATYKGYTFYGNRTDPATLSLSIPSGMASGMLTANQFVRKTAIGSRSITATFTNTSNVLTAISAADMVGMDVGQTIFDPALTGGHGTVTAVGATTLTLNTTANSNVTKLTLVNDVIVFNASPYNLASWNSFASTLNGEPVSLSAASMDPPAALTTTILNDYYAPRKFAIIQQRSLTSSASFTIQATNGQNYVPQLPSTTATALTVTTTTVANGIAWSEQGQPEAVPTLNTLPVGSGTLYGGWATRDSLWIFASDGLWQLTGTGGAAGRGFDWSVINRDSSLSLSAPHGACVLRDSVYAYTNRGLVAVSSKGIDENLSQGRINDLLPGPPFSATRDIQMWADETNDEIWLAVNATTSPVIYVYNTLSDAWTTHPGDSSSTPFQGTYARFLQDVVTIDQNNAYSPNHVTASFAPMVLDYQPISDGDALTLRQWIDECWVFDTATATFLSAGIPVKPTPRWNGVDYASAAQAAKSQSQDSRVSWCVPRNAPAVANTLAPGLKVASTAYPMSIYGLALRSVPLTSQRKQR